MPLEKLTRARIVEALNLLGELCEQEQVTLELCLYGGSAMLLAYSARETTKDMDVTARPSETALRLARTVAQRLNLDESWMIHRFPEGKICDAFLAATADYLSRVNGVPTPAWALNEDLVLDQPWFTEEFPQLRLRLLRDTPSAFKDKNPFVFESALSVV
jgi:hypothetical protein